jgi:hypothetical protein
MKKILVCVVAALALPAPAAAKEVQSLSVCGLRGCAQIKGPAAQDYIVLLQRGGEVDDRDVTTPVAAAPYYRLTFTIRGEPTAKPFTIGLWYVRPNLTRQELSQPFREVPAGLVAGLEGAASRVTAFPAARVVAATVNGRRAADPGAYTALFGRLPAAETGTTPGNVKLVLRANRANPWFGRAAPLRYAAATRTLFLTTPVRVPDDIAARIARDGHLTVSMSFALLAALAFGGAFANRRRRVVALAAVAGAFAFPGVAGAKEIQSVSVCGKNGCKAVAGAVQPFRDTFEGQGGANEPRTILGAVPVRPFYRVGIRIKGDRTAAGTFSIAMWYLPPNVIRFGGGVRDLLSEPFRRIPAALAAQLQAATTGLQPFPAPRVMRAYVDDKRVDDARMYIHLFDNLQPTDATADTGTQFVNLALVPDRPNPWFADGVTFLYSNEAQSIFLVKPLKVGDDLAGRIADDAGLPSPVRDSGAGWGKPVGAGILSVAVLLAIGFLVAVSRRRHRAQPSTA